MSHISHEQTTNGVKDDLGNHVKDAPSTAPPESVQHTESRLLKLLDEFNSGNMLSFGPNCPYDKLDAIREQQEELVRLHFEQDKKAQNLMDPEYRRSRRPVQLLSEDDWNEMKSNVNALITKLESLSNAVEDLHRTTRTT